MVLGLCQDIYIYIYTNIGKRTFYSLQTCLVEARRQTDRTAGEGREASKGQQEPNTESNMFKLTRGCKLFNYFVKIYMGLANLLSKRRD